MGKLTTQELKEMLECVKKSPEVVIPPLPGFDSGVHMMGSNECLVVSTDPCIGVPESWFGWLLVHYAASDVALFGAKPEFCAITLLGPLSMRAAAFMKVMKQASRAADELNTAIVTGHTGTYDGLSTLVGVCTAYGRVARERLITPKDARAGDQIVCTKYIGLETIVNFSLTHRALAEHLFGAKRAHELQNLVSEQTCVRAATLLAESGVAHAMHDATEGGLVAALNEMAEASGTGFAIAFKNLPLLKETRVLQEHFGLSMDELLSLSSTGTVLASVDPEKTDEVLQGLRRQGIEACQIGTFTKSKKRVMERGKKKLRFPEIAKDPYAKLMLAER